MQRIRNIDLNTLDFSKGNGLMPVIIQDISSLQVLMQAYMNREALAQTMQTGRATFFSRSKNRLWIKGETSGNYLFAQEILADCDNDCLLIMVKAKGPACHTGSISCFDTGKEADLPSPGRTEETTNNHTMQEKNSEPFAQYTQHASELQFLTYLEKILYSRKQADPEKSYTARLFAAGTKRIAKKLGEEAVELVLEAESGEKERFTEEAADLIYHLTVLLIQKGVAWDEVVAELKKRHG